MWQDFSLNCTSRTREKNNNSEFCFGFDAVWAWGTMLMNFQKEREIEGGKTWNLFSLDNLTLTSCEVSYKPIDIFLQKRNYTKVHKFYGIFDIHALMMHSDSVKAEGNVP